jgi:hypothetical protein
MDYTYVVKHLKALTEQLPQADMYVGYSAGSIIVSAAEVPKVLVACPLTLVRQVSLLRTEDVLNIMHYRDPVAAPVPGAENVVVKDWSAWRFLNPLAAHMQCMNNADVLKHTIRWYKKHLGE